MLIPNIQATQVDPIELSIINSTLVLMIRTGFKQVTMQQIIQSSDLSKSQIYRYFASKEDLICRILLANEMDLSECLDTWLVSEHKEKLLELYLQFLIKRLEKHRLLQRLELFVETDLTENELANQWQRLKHRNLARLEAELTVPKLASHMSSCEFTLLQSLLKGLARNHHNDYFDTKTSSSEELKQCILHLFNQHTE